MDQAGALSGRACLVDRIQKAIAFYKNKIYKPPFTPDELFTMAVAVTGRPVTKGQVLKWVFANFQHYRSMIEEEFVDDDPKQLVGPGYWRRPERDSDRFRTSINEVPRNYELYLKARHAQNGPDSYTMTVASCERILFKVLSSKQELNRKAFRFMDLPPELRNTIFDLVFQYPRSGLLFEAKGQKTAFVGPPAHRDALPYIKLQTLSKTARITDVLAPLLVNRQFYEEAKSCFFAINHFLFADGYTMSLTLNKIPESQRRHIHHLTLDYGIGSYKLTKARKAIALLATCGLKKLNVYLDEEEWKELGTTRRGRAFKYSLDIMNIPGLRKLRTMRGLEEVHFYGCPTVEALIKADMLKPKPKPKKKGMGGRKRKAEGDSE
ncbi:hypothetical protein KC318_g5150, partial [Hortaea werneckii]